MTLEGLVKFDTHDSWGLESLEKFDTFDSSWLEGLEKFDTLDSSRLESLEKFDSFDSSWLGGLEKFDTLDSSWLEGLENFDTLDSSRPEWLERSGHEVRDMWSRKKMFETMTRASLLSEQRGKETICDDYISGKLHNLIPPSQSINTLLSILAYHT